MFREDKSMQADLSRLSKACCSSSGIAGTRRSSVADFSRSNRLCGQLTHSGRAATGSQQERLAICPDST